MVLRSLPQFALTLAFAVALSVFVPSAEAGCYCTPDQCDICDLCYTKIDCCHDKPELWLVNTRCLPKCQGLDCGFERISIKRYDRETCCWVRETHESFLAHEAANPMPTLLFAHGNTLKHKGALEQMNLLTCKFKCCPGKKRLVFWSWPAQVVYKRPILRPREVIEKNLKIKFVYAEYQGYYMAKFVQPMQTSTRVTLGGHSYGGIIASVAAHYLGGGSLRCLTLEGAQPVERPNLRLAIVSGAYDNDAMIPGMRYGQSFVAAEKVMNTRNCIDKTLQNWPKVSSRCRKAVGVTGINANLLGEHYNKLCQITMTRDVGKSHYIEPHMKSSRLVNLLCCIAFPQCEMMQCKAADSTCNECQAEHSGTESLETCEEKVLAAGPLLEVAGHLMGSTVSGVSK